MRRLTTPPSPLADRLFAGGCTVVFLLLLGGVANAVALYWR